MMQTCRQCNVQFEVTDQDQAFYGKMDVPPPTLCPSCRMQRRTAFRNERNLYKRKCDFSGKEIISIYPPDSPYKVYDQKVWQSDQWDPMDYGRGFDFGRSFFDQFRELSLDVPRISLQNYGSENSEYCNDSTGAKNCYLCFNTGRSEDSHYCTTYGMGSSDCMDMFWCLGSELCYECIKVMQGYHCFWCVNSSVISDCYFCEDMRSCKNCFGCIGLRQKEYYIYNKYVGKEKFEEFMKNFKFTREGVDEVKKKVDVLRMQVPHRNLEIQNSEDCLGDYIENCKNCTFAFDVMNSENIKYFWDGIADNSYDCFNTGVNTNFAYECLATYNATNVKFSNKCEQSSDLIYCDHCTGSEHLFGCNGLRHKKYCILNKQYTKEEYEALVPRVIEHMKQTPYPLQAASLRSAVEFGEFFPVSLSPYGYNDTMAQEYFPLSKEEALRKGFNWNDYKNPKPQGLKYIPAGALPGDIDEISDDIVKWVLECEKDKKFFKITPWELRFYKKQGLPIPTLCPDCRHYERKGRINPRRLYNRACKKCNVEMLSTYEPSRPEIVYCEKCYLEMVI